MIKKSQSLSGEDFAAECDVSRETLERLTTYLDLLKKWQPRINLVGASTLHDPWRRHILDSAQVFPYLPKTVSRLIDLGSGAGFPGLVLAILGVPEVHLVESDSRKTAFLREASRLCEVKTHIHNCRIESIKALKADVVTSRALAPLNDLIDYADEFIDEKGLCIFLKGKDVNQELTDSVRTRIKDINSYPSRSDQDGCVLVLRLRKVHSDGIERG